MPQTPNISVIVPVYNVERYVKLCIDSILAQSFQDFEVIIIDDASPDNSYKICQELYGTNEKVRIIRHEKNQGLGPARNTGIENARGKYVYFVDSDDAIVPQALEILYNVAEKTDADVVHTSEYFETEQDDDEPLSLNRFKMVREPHNTEGFLNPNILHRWENCWQRWDNADGIRPMAWLTFCKSEILKKYQLRFEPIISEDELFSFEIFTYVEKFFTINKAVYVYRQRENSIMKTNSPQRLEKGIRAMFVTIAKMKFVMNRFAELRNKTDFQEHFINRLLDAHRGNHIRPFYANGLNVESLTVINNILDGIFGETATFVKYFFNRTNSLQVQFDNLNMQAGQLYLAYQQLAQRQQRMSLFLQEQAAILKIFDEMDNDFKKIFLVGTPRHGNIGDQAIVFAEYFVLKNLFPDHQIIDVPYPYLMDELSEIFYGLGFQKYVQPDDLMVMHGGGNLGNLWINEEIFRRSIIEKFHGNKIIIFPQSVHFTNDAEGQKQAIISKQIYNAHPDLHLMLRDENSYNLANDIFPEINTYLLPDVVTSLYGITDKVNVEREGVLFVLRHDKEKVRDDSNVQRLQEFLMANNIPFSVTDTVIDEIIYKENREQKILDVLMKIRQSRLVITDRFHGVVFSYITRTPVMAFKSFDTKISSGIKWFKDIPSIYYAESANFDDMTKFILKSYNGQSLPAQVNTNFAEKFTEIFQTILHKQIEISAAPFTNRLIVDNIEILDNAIVYRYTVQGIWKKFFNPNVEFFIDYSENISATPKNIAVIPLLCNFLPMAWVFNAEIIVPELDKDFYDNLDEAKHGYAEMYPRINFGGKLTVKNLVENNYEVSNGTAAFFSGGVDSFNTLISHADEHPALITLWGSDVKLDDVKGWNNVTAHALETAKNFGCKNLLVRSSFRYVINEGKLTQEVMPLSGDGWWHGFQHGIGIIGHAAPYVYKHRLGKLYIASTYTPSDKGNYTCASDPTIDNHVKVGKCITVHDGYEFNRQEKVHRICEYKRSSGIEINLRVCWESKGGENCCACEKCYRTILEIIAEGEEPAQFGFKKFPANLDKMKADYATEKFFNLTHSDILISIYRAIQNRFNENPERLKKYGLEWFMDIDFSERNLKRGGAAQGQSFDNVLPYRLKSNVKEYVKKEIHLAIPMSICNFRCHYCYLSQRPESYQGVQPTMKYSPEQVAKALSKKRLGGLAYINVCADGETLLLKDVDIYMKRLVEEGHYVEFVTNCTITNVLKKFLAWDKELLAHIEFKCSFHYLELKKKNMLEVFARNVNDIWEAGASANVEITPNDELIPYIDEIKEFSMKNFGALPHITIARDDRTQGIEILSKLPKDEYYKIWGQFDSTMFNYKKTIFGKRQEEFCYAGIWSANIDLSTGIAKGCYCGRSLGDVFANPESDFPTFPVGKCPLPHCYNGHAYMTFGNIPNATKVTFADIRNRVRSDGTEWLKPKLKSFFSTQLYQSNEELTNVEKFNFMVRNQFGL